MKMEEKASIKGRKYVKSKEKIKILIISPAKKAPPPSKKKKTNQNLICKRPSDNKHTPRPSPNIISYFK